MDPSANTPYPPNSDAGPGMPQPQKTDVSDVPPPYSPPTQGYPPMQGYGPPQGMAYPPPQPGIAVTTYQTVPPNDAIIRSTQHSTSTTQVVMVGAGAQCPKCRTGVLQEDFTLLGICCAIFFFPLGLICCLMMRQRRCTYCGAVYM